MALYARLKTAPLLRPAGAGLLAIAAAIAARLFAAPTSVPGAGEALGALILFVSGSGGSALLVLGGRLFAPVPLPPQWQRRF